MYLAGEINMSDNSVDLHQQLGGNPLQKHFRQPKIYITLPSKGKWYPEGSIEMPDNGQLPVFAMTAKDEITMRTPDALLNGQSTVDIIHSCIPNIKNAWQMPNIDLDACLIAIRIASVGETMTISTKVPNTDIEKDFQLDLRMLLDQYAGVEYTDVFQVDDFLVQIRPSTYQTYTQNAIKTFEEQRVFSIVADNSIDDKQKLQMFNKSLQTLTEINLNLVFDSVVAIQYKQEEAVTNRNHIREFLENSDSTVYNKIKDHVDQIKQQFQTKPIPVQSTEEEITAGAPPEYEVPVMFDHSSFFAQGS